MWIRKQIEIGWSDLLFALNVSFFSRLPDRRNALSLIAKIWPENDPVVSLSVRTGFDCMLQSVRWPTGSEVIMSGLTIPDMPRIVERNGFRVVPVDINEATMAPDVDAVARAITPYSKALVIAHLFGKRIPLEPFAELAKKHNLLLIEDCAQAFSAGDSGSSIANVSMFSFGPIKSSTALGGGILQIRDDEIRNRMRSIESTYPQHSNRKFGRRVLKYLGIKAASNRRCAGLLFSALRVAGYNPDRVVSSLARGFAGSDFFARIRQQPSTALLSLLARRLQSFDSLALNRRIAQANRLSYRLNNLRLAGSSSKVSESLATVDSSESTYWVTPVCTRDARSAQQLVAELSQHGFDATRRSSLSVVEPTRPAKSPAISATQITALPVASSIVDRMVFLPLCDGMQVSDLDQMARIANRVCSRSSQNVPSLLRFE
ncbi:DegT/DnrJ/EryC1/StrS family aminotransferase [Mariniblastus fucicola]|uniref:dTDP-3-amino-3,6-dideoxy-alpha-D-galactopyranose transaminase n=1 Tax=Mariniblastus fucicola TaxID=980251 RepID=A0A5B9P9K1_9BACT|nr:aminotransferase class V-fold PLP-dependent enzyme [Mariniblastus fucicola]QEG22129.1 dTDP-3-amino-3,6-dideoxy-alpha-D-galactopyranose transaminase [Mariniblastus fucicola]